MAKRKALSKMTRFEVFKRDGFACQYCGRTPPAVVLQVDHISPVSKGGTNDQINLLTACCECNSGKTNRELSSVPAPLAAQIMEQKERRAQVEAYNDFLMDIRLKTAQDIEEMGFYWFDKYKAEKGGWTFGPGREPTVKRFLSALAKAEIMDAMDIAYGKFPVRYDRDDQTFRYFCGICWRKIKGGVN